MLRQLSAESVSAVATTSEEELESPAATGMVPETITDIIGIAVVVLVVGYLYLAGRRERNTPAVA